MFNLGFRPFFLGAGSYAVISMFIWWLQYSGYINSAALTPAWHAHEMLFGYTFAVIVGFLLTSVRNWTGIETISGAPLFALFSLWAVARLANILGLMEVAAASDLAFTLWFGWCAIAPIVKVRQWRQTAIVGMVAVMVVANSLYYAGQISDSQGPLLSGGIAMGNYLGFYVILGLVLMMAGRVVPFFTQLGVDGAVKLPTNPRLEILNFIIYGMFAIANLAMINGAEVADVISGLALLLTILNIKRLATWYIKGIWRKPLLWTLFLAYSFIVLGFALYALLYFGWFNIFIPIHAVAVGGIGLLTLSMMARVSLGHSGRSIHEPPASISMAFVILIVASLSRILLPVVVPAYYLTWIQLSQFLWLIAFSIFLLAYAPMLTQPRIDNKPG